MLLFIAAWVDEYTDTDNLSHHLFLSKPVCKNRINGENESKKGKWSMKGSE